MLPSYVILVQWGGEGVRLCRGMSLLRGLACQRYHPFLLIFTLSRRDYKSLRRIIQVRTEVSTYYVTHCCVNPTNPSSSLFRFNTLSVTDHVHRITFEIHRRSPSQVNLHSQFPSRVDVLVWSPRVFVTFWGGQTYRSVGHRYGFESRMMLRIGSLSTDGVT